jgi:hypothetical protein
MSGDLLSHMTTQERPRTGISVSHAPTSAPSAAKTPYRDLSLMLNFEQRALVQFGRCSLASRGDWMDKTSEF